MRRVVKDTARVMSARLYLIDLWRVVLHISTNICTGNNSTDAGYCKAFREIYWIDIGALMKMENIAPRAGIEPTSLAF